MAAWSALEKGVKRSALVWHRRAGKDSMSLNWTAASAFDRVGTYWHLAPTGRQVRKIVWDGIDGQGRRVIDQAFPSEIRTRMNDQEMRIELANGSIWQCVGSDNYDLLVGANPVGVVFSEWSLSDPIAWDYVRPILAENGGWAMFIFTPRGRNHGWRLWDSVQGNEEWFTQLLNVEDTKAVPLEIIERERKEMAAQRGESVAEAMMRQEWYCSFDAPVEGSYYAAPLAAAQAAGRICKLAADPLMTYRAYWDIGGTGAKADACAIWVCQFIGAEIRILDYYEQVGQPLAAHVEWLRKHGYGTAQCVLPHDGGQHEKVANVTYESALRGADFDVRVVPNMGAGAAMQRIEALRRVFPQCWFDEDRTRSGRDALAGYHEKWDDRRAVGLGPAHDWASHGADAGGLMAVDYLSTDRTPVNLKALMEYTVDY